MRPAQRAWRVVNGLGWDNFYGAWAQLVDVPVTQERPGTDPWSLTLPGRWQQAFETMPATTGLDTGDLILPLLALQFEERLTVLDFGGGTGVGLANIRRFTRIAPSRLCYVLVETPAMCAAVREGVAAQGGRVLDEVPQVLPAPLIVNASSSLQYVSDYRATLSQLARLEPAAMVISQTPVTAQATYARQVLNTPHKKMATWVFNRTEFVAELSSLGYRLVFSADHDLPLTHGHAPGPSAMASMVFFPGDA